MNPKPRHKQPTRRENRLARRISDYDRMVGDPRFSNVPQGAYHKPGSLRK